jgi:hypothetical protein
VWWTVGEGVVWWDAGGPGPEGPRGCARVACAICVGSAEGRSDGPRATLSDAWGARTKKITPA